MSAPPSSIKPAATMITVKSCACLLFIIGAFLVQSIQTTVDPSRPDLSMFKLRPTNSGKLARERASTPIRDYATGAILMRETAYTDNLQARCSAYAHLLKLISRADLHDIKPGTKQLKLDTVVALNIVADADRDLYNKLFQIYRASTLKQVFLSAIEQLELMTVQTSSSKEAWLDLIDCATRFNSTIRLDSFLAKPRRVKLIEQWNKFNKLANDDDDDDNNLNNLTNDKQATGSLPDSGKAFSDEELQEARIKVEQFDDNELVQLRQKLLAGQAVAVAAAELPAKPTSSDVYMPPSLLSQQQQQQQRPQGPVDSVVDDDQLKLVITVPVPVQNKDTEVDIAELVNGEYLDNVDDKAVKSHIMVMAYIKRWLRMLDSSVSVANKFKMSIQSASDFNEYWNELKQLRDKLNPASPLTKLVVKYLSDTANMEVAKRMDETLAIYGQITDIIARIQATNSYKSFDELKEPYEYLLQLLAKIDKIINVQEFNQSVKQYNEYKVINSFINNDYWL